MLIEIEATPNPATLRFLLPRPLPLSEPIAFERGDDPRPRLAGRLLGATGLGTARRPTLRTPALGTRPGDALAVALDLVVVAVERADAHLALADGVERCRGRPLGRQRAMDPEAAAVAGDRVRRLAFLMGSGKLVRGVRMVATDVDWDRGKGPTVTGPMQELLMLASGRAPDLSLLSGDGLAAVPARS